MAHGSARAPDAGGVGRTRVADDRSSTARRLAGVCGRHPGPGLPGSLRRHRQLVRTAPVPGMDHLRAGRRGAEARRGGLRVGGARAGGVARVGSRGPGGARRPRGDGCNPSRAAPRRGSGAGVDRRAAQRPPRVVQGGGAGSRVRVGPVSERRAGRGGSAFRGAQSRRGVVFRRRRLAARIGCGHGDRAMTVAHLSDLHLGYGAGTAGRASDAARVFEEAFARIAGIGPKLVVIAGDIFDHPDVTAPPIATFTRAIHQLRERVPDVVVAMVAGVRDTPLDPSHQGPLAVVGALESVEAATVAVRRLVLLDGDLSVTLVPHHAARRARPPKLEPDRAAKWNVLVLHGVPANAGPRATLSKPGRARGAA
ncbi:MAG: hypothetical protein F4059_00500, partial [Gemmatimonadetes bacterium]|nr:hypothetical protein [Gemmatimonadota bacterium]